MPAFKISQWLLSAFMLIIMAASPGAEDIHFNFSIPDKIGSPLVFGGIAAPNLSHIDAWNKLVEYGFTTIRWLQRSGYASACHSRGLVYVAQTDYACGASTYNGEWNGVPRDWDEYSNNIKARVQADLGKVDYYEIWNEPDLQVNTFLKIAGSPYEDEAWVMGHIEELYGTDRAQWPEWATRSFANEQEKIDFLKKPVAYHDIYYYTAKAIKQVDTGAIIGVGAMANPGYDWFGAYIGGVLSDPRIPSEWAKFGTYHRYGDTTNRSVTWMGIDVAKAYGRPDLTGWMCTEWNMSADNVTAYQGMSERSISYAAFRLCDFLRGEAMAAHMFTVQAVQREGDWNFYIWAGDHVERMAHKAKVFRLMSKTFGLGKDSCRVVQTDVDLTRGFAAINSDGNPLGIVINNTESELADITVHFDHIGGEDAVNIATYLVSADNEGLDPVAVSSEQLTDGSFSYTVPTLPPWSIAGMILDYTVGAKPEAEIGRAPLSKMAVTYHRGSQVEISFAQELLSRGAERIGILSLDGSCVRTIYRRAGSTRVKWDFRDSEGRPVSPGTYIIVAPETGAKCSIVAAK